MIWPSKLSRRFESWEQSYTSINSHWNEQNKSNKNRCVFKLIFIFFLKWFLNLFLNFLLLILVFLDFSNFLDFQYWTKLKNSKNILKNWKTRKNWKIRPMVYTKTRKWNKLCKKIWCKKVEKINSTQLDFEPSIC